MNMFFLLFNFSPLSHPKQFLPQSSTSISQTHFRTTLSPTHKPISSWAISGTQPDWTREPISARGGGTVLDWWAPISISGTFLTLSLLGFVIWLDFGLFLFGFTGRLEWVDGFVRWVFGVVGWIFTGGLSCWFGYWGDFFYFWVCTATFFWWFWITGFMLLIFVIEAWCICESIIFCSIRVLKVVV